MWVFDETLARMVTISHKQTNVFHSIEYCSREELEYMWEESDWKRANYVRLLERDDLINDEVKCIEEKINALEIELDIIDYEWSRFDFQ